MKLLTRISSISRMVWKACRSCSPASRLEVGRLAGEPTRRRVHGLAVLPPGTSVTRLLGEPVDLAPRRLLAATPGDRQVAPRVPARWARRGRARACLGASGAASECGTARCTASVAAEPRRGSSPIAQVHRAPVRAPSAGGPHHRASASSPPVSSASSSARSGGWQRSSSPWTTSTGQRTCEDRSSVWSRSVDAGIGPGVGREEILRVLCSAHPTTVLDHCFDRVRLREQLAREEPDRTRGSPSASSGRSYLAPTPPRCPAPRRKAYCDAIRQRRRSGTAARERRRPRRDPFGVPRRPQQGVHAELEQIPRGGWLDAELRPSRQACRPRTAPSPYAAGSGPSDRPLPRRVDGDDACVPGQIGRPAPSRPAIR